MMFIVDDSTQGDGSEVFMYHLTFYSGFWLANDDRGDRCKERKAKYRPL